MIIFNACFLLRRILLFNRILLIRVVFLFPWSNTCYLLNQTRLNKGGQVRLIWFTLVNCDSLYRFNFFSITHAIVKPNCVYPIYPVCAWVVAQPPILFHSIFISCFYWIEKYFAGGIINLLNAKIVITQTPVNWFGLLWVKHNVDFRQIPFDWLYNIASIFFKPNKRIIEIKDIKANIHQVKNLFQQNVQRHSILKIFQLTWRIFPLLVCAKMQKDSRSEKTLSEQCITSPALLKELKCSDISDWYRIQV